MRNFTIRNGRFKGQHPIYESVQEAKDAGVTPKEPWHREDIIQGDWVISDDGLILQCLHRYQLYNKLHRSGQYTDVFRFANGSFYVYINKVGERVVGKNFYANVAHNNKGSIGNTSRLGRFMTPQKKLFVSLIGEGLDPYTAYLKAFNRGFATYNINKLLEDPVIKEALMEELKPFVNKISSELKEKTGLNLTDYIANELVNIITFDVTKLALKERRENIKLVLALFGEQLGLIPPKKESKREIQDINYELVRAPELGPGNVKD